MLQPSSDFIYSNLYRCINVPIMQKLGLYIVQLLVAISILDQNNLRLAYNISFDSRNMIEQGIYKMRLNNEQANFLINSRIAHLHPLSQPNEVVIEPYNYIIKTMPNFTIPDYVKYANLSNNYYLLELEKEKYILYSDEIIWYEKLEKPSLHNKYSSEFILSGSEIVGPPATAYRGKKQFSDDISFVYPRVVNRLGLDGGGEVVTLTDTGIDLYHPFFHDQRQKLPLNSTNDRHRKIVRYDTIHNETEFEKGHGSHIAATIAGEIEDEDYKLNDYNGVAQAARLYVVGINKNENEMSFNNYSIQNLYQTSYNLGSFIHVNTWGITSKSQSKLASSYHNQTLNDNITLSPYDDKHLLMEAYDTNSVDNPDVVTIFSVGNEQCYGCIASPADSKNVLSVGSMRAPIQTSIHKANNRMYYIEGRNDAIPITHIKWSKDPFESNYNSSLQPLENIPLRLSKPDDNGDFNDVFVLYTSVPKCHNLEEGVRGYLIPGDANLECPDSNFIVFGYNNVDTEELSKTRSITIIIDPIPYKNEPGVSLFSAFGPTKTGIFKPDLVAPGENVYSAAAGNPFIHKPRESNWNSLMPMSGTSVATATIAGAAAIVRQYFAEGYYPNRTKTQGMEMNPSASLVKAILIASAVPINHTNPNKGGPTPESGFGVPHLYKTLGIDIYNEEMLDDDSEFGMRAYDTNQITSKGQNIFTIKVQYPNQSLVVVMSYLDFAIDYTNMKPLVVDLDLILITPNGDVEYGNQCDYGEDNFATNERIIIENAPVGEYTCIVKASKFSFNRTIEYALVFQGGFNNSDYEANPIYQPPFVSDACFVECLNQTCSNGGCNCNNNKTGYLCEHEILEVSGDYSFVFHPKEIKYFKVSTSKKMYFWLFSPSENVTAHYCVNKNRIKKIADFDNTCNYTNTQLLNFFKPKRELYIAIWAVSPFPVNISFSIKPIDFPTPIPPTPQRTLEYFEEKMEMSYDFIALLTSFIMIVIIGMRYIRQRDESNKPHYSSKQSKLAAESSKKEILMSENDYLFNHEEL